MEKNIFEVLSGINCNDKVEKKNNLNYLSWIWAWTEVKKRYPSANYNVVNFEGKPYLFDENLGYMVQTIVTIDNETIGMQLPVMDGANKAQKHVDYEYQTKYGKKVVLAATMFDINTAIMRCLTKNLAMFGLGSYIYAGEDLPENQEPQKTTKAEPAQIPIKKEVEKQGINGKILIDVETKLFNNIALKINTGEAINMEIIKKHYDLTPVAEEKLQQFIDGRAK